MIINRVVRELGGATDYFPMVIFVVLGPFVEVLVQLVVGLELSPSLHRSFNRQNNRKMPFASNPRVVKGRKLHKDLVFAKFILDMTLS